jgi:hypothetical protein
MCRRLIAVRSRGSASFSRVRSLHSAAGAGFPSLPIARLGATAPSDRGVSPTRPGSVRPIRRCGSAPSHSITRQSPGPPDHGRLRPRRDTQSSGSFVDVTATAPAWICDRAPQHRGGRQPPADARNRIRSADHPLNRARWSLTVSTPGFPVGVSPVSRSPSVAQESSAAGQPSSVHGYDRSRDERCVIGS